jgi:two-component system, cell cycle sensor histidine kinase and response regulator CckA
MWLARAVRSWNVTRVIDGSRGFMISPEDRLNLVQTEAFEPPTGIERPHILLVEDDDMLRSIIQLGLEKLGYAVSSAHSGKSALETAAQHQDIHLLLTDIVMPEMSGVELAEKLRKTHPRLEVLYVSGHLRATIDLPVDSIHFLQKPFRPGELDDRIKAILAKHN